MKKILLPAVLIVAIIVSIGVLKLSGFFLPDEKVYVAVEGAGYIAVIDSKKQTRFRTIDLSIEQNDSTLTFAPHNVQVSPDGKSVWATANMDKNRDVDARHLPNEVVVIDPITDSVIKRIPTSPGIFLAHIAFTTDNKYAYVTAQMEGVIYKINASTYTIEKKINTGIDSEPHGIRMSPDGSSAYIAFFKSKGFGILDLKTDTVTVTSLPGTAVQTGVTPDGEYVVVSIFDTKQLAIYNTKTKKMDYLELPADAKGPIQMYPTPDSRFMYLADQGYYFGTPVGTQVYKIDIAAQKIVKEIKVGQGPHGVVVSKDGAFVYVTNILSGKVSVIDTSTDQEISTIWVGKEPNGISAWSKKLGGTP
ncbi:MAG: 40-residue YVTN family beta-propeller repeat protein [Parcubacteria group bacterium GW2011_GWA1_44_13]|uniref:40-residue YVTN family beta-propeller repeat protein n=1 Tax=Candidatus Nomurabacteria bacterium GW2011_GWB1_44_12 TaxID=1618748 RepID=A0A837I7Y9_9BACT|nr:MAG: 40-residue YVTN family beta-propeller repeat protein [Candidatus Nomurabacteria bacterium GW2011_GWB1_44_12]KKT37911.1 MAG: 40-residue YVTN family beta-propeller repeat protein [Parcubacteria group bacterium GW2011_GWA1_44_13]HBB44256.1 hypothetical protein [Candidatus Yonathbacteria bacterium]